MVLPMPFCVLLRWPGLASTEYADFGAKLCQHLEDQVNSLEES